jgi:hypothetical protein
VGGRVEERAGATRLKSRLNLLAGVVDYGRSMLRALPLLLLTTAPALAAHSGAISRRTMPELSDLALAAMAAGGLWLAQRAMRRRARARRESGSQD